MRKLLLAVIVIGILGFIIYKGNTTVGTTNYTLSSKRLPASFDGYKIVQLSDLHDAVFGEKHADIVNEVVKIAPDAIYITGDFIDRNRYDLEQSLLLVEAIKDVAPIYYVTGNHEISINDVDRIKSSLQELGVHVLTDEREILSSPEGEKILIGGIEDPLSSLGDEQVTVERAVEKAFDGVPQEMFKILLSHRPEHFDVYVRNGIDVTFSGHAHGGQVRIPGIGGLISPGQGIFPKLTSGIHEKDGSQLVVSRGIGNSLFPVRVFNKPEIVVVTLKKNY
ncbi:metallophosphoesterase [Sporosarcina sp. Marseille-Q4063]|uniref:metallophosphoesterase n=1 Tax=Sporosarcina sp. Marseille-Q4063 TaxID=2810514 RepID=UPI001BAED514|nr:metallophosphoesterase [Sporosarcina sp. Marseille-Q4063]QUW22664.1 metallophosphoesterase [Sporosarcina sp. Marseille-Q4063]